MRYREFFGGTTMATQTEKREERNRRDREPRK